MCLGEICQVIAMEPDGRVRVKGEAREQLVSLMTLEKSAEVGDWLVVHSGFALGWLDPHEAADARALRATPTSQHAFPAAPVFVQAHESSEDPAPAAPADHPSPAMKGHS